MARILLIEDNEDSLEVMTCLVEAAGHVAIAARDGDHGFLVAGSETPHLIVCDLHMPKVNGYEVCRRLKAHPTLGNIPLVAVTALAMVGDREKVLASGFDGYISKPIDPRNFVRQLESFLDKSQPGATTDG